eukprot:TRINITY_DN7693_c0_g1_i1.p2 TRINITY_DN7693_c0_g1~~TRINITY_DN7693_c0_g1_i1.p2  ORF type:complete len:1029 (-),score=261.30 TRINITY_DN7693_c0_g1_i1:3301-6387(-)
MQLLVCVLALVASATLVASLPPTAWHIEQSVFYAEQARESLNLHPGTMKILGDANPTAPDYRGGRRVWIFHLKALPLNDIKLAVESVTGLKLTTFMPYNMFMVSCEQSVAMLAASVPGVTGVEEYPVEGKVSADTPISLQSGSQKQLTVVFAADYFATVAQVEHHVAQWRSAGVEVVEISSVEHVVVKATAATFQQTLILLENDHAVIHIAPQEEFFTLNNNAHGVTQSGTPFTTPVWNKGIQGQGQVVAVADTGLDMTSCFFSDPAVNLTLGVVNMNARKVVLYQNIADGLNVQDAHGTHVAGSIAGNTTTATLANYNGMAPAAKIAFQDIHIGSNSEANSLTVPSDLYNGLFLFPYVNASARIHSNSWGTTANSYTASSRYIDRFMWDYPDMLILFANGNSGSQGLGTVGSPATAKNCLSVGASMNAPASFDNYLSARMTIGGTTLAAVPGDFGPIGVVPVTANIVNGSPNSGCSTMASAEGKIVVVQRGGCTFLQMALNVQAAGGVYLVVVSNGGVLQMTSAESADTSSYVYIPSIMISQTDGTTLLNYIATEGAAASATIQLGPSTPTSSANWNINNVAYFSSRGPTLNDGRIKPDVTGPGEFVFSARAAGSGRTGSSCSIKVLQGTSMATPVVAGTAALLRQYFTEGWHVAGVKDISSGINPAASLLKAMLVNSAEELTGSSPNYPSTVVPTQFTSLAVPVMYQGFGRVQLSNVLKFSDNTVSLSVVNGQPLTTGSLYTQCFQVAPSTASLRVTLAWTDYAATTTAFIAAVNNLNLLVESASGIGYTGNQAQLNVTSYDSLNNVESVRVTSPAAGTWVVNVMAAYVPQGPQPFSLVVSGGGTAVTCPTLSCPNTCSGVGSCNTTNGVCVCPFDRAGVDCSIVVRLLNDTAYSVVVTPFQMQYFYIDISPALASRATLQFSWARIAGSGDPDMLLKYGALPSYTQYDGSDFSGESGVAGHTVTLSSSSTPVLQAGYLYVAIVGFCCVQSTVGISLGTVYSAAPMVLPAIVMTVILPLLTALLML